MPLYDQFPYTNFHELNLDWLVKKVSNLEAAFPEGTVGISKGGTGADNATQARQNLGVIASNIPMDAGSSSTVAQVISILSDNINTLAEDIQYRLFRLVSDLGLTSGTATLASCWTAMSAGDILLAPPSEFAPGQVPENYGSVIMIRSAGTSGSLRFYGSQTYEQPFSNNYPSGTWNQLFNSTDIIPIANGGTGADNAADALHNLGIDFTGEVLSVAGVGASPNGDVPLKINDLTNVYSDISDLGLGTGSTIGAVYDIMPTPSVAVLPLAQIANPPSNTGSLIIIKNASSSITAVDNAGRTYSMIMSNNAPTGNWKAPVMMRKFTTESQTIVAGGEGHSDTDVSVAGYTPVGVVGIQGNGNSGMYVTDFYLIGSTVSMWYRNPGTSSRTFTYQIAVLYI